VVGDAAEDVSQIGLRIEAVELDARINLARWPVS
jgi:hypothetical protein